MTIHKKYMEHVATRILILTHTCTLTDRHSQVCVLYLHIVDLCVPLSQRTAFRELFLQRNETSMWNEVEETSFFIYFFGVVHAVMHDAFALVTHQNTNTISTEKRPCAVQKCADAMNILANLTSRGLLGAHTAHVSRLLQKKNQNNTHA
jgi:hypothetical protein